MLQYVQPNLISEIMYHFVVVKQELQVDDWHRICKKTYYEPQWIPSLRQQAPESEERPEEINIDVIPMSRKLSPTSPSMNASMKSSKKAAQPVKKKSSTHK